MNKLKLLELCVKYPEVVDLLIKQSEQIKELQQLIEDMDDYIEKLRGWEN